MDRVSSVHLSAEAFREAASHNNDWTGTYRDVLGSDWAEAQKWAKKYAQTDRRASSPQGKGRERRFLDIIEKEEKITLLRGDEKEAPPQEGAPEFTRLDMLERRLRSVQGRFRNHAQRDALLAQMTNKPTKVSSTSRYHSVTSDADETGPPGELAGAGGLDARSLGQAGTEGGVHDLAYETANTANDASVKRLLVQSLDEEHPRLDHAAAAPTSSREVALSLRLACTAGDAGKIKSLFARFLGEPKALMSLATDGHGRTALHYVCLYGNVKAALVLVQHGADVNARTAAGQSPLHTACCNGRLKLATFLLASGAVRDARDGVGWTALHCAARWGHADIVQELLASGCRTDVRTPAGKTAQEIAFEHGHSTAAHIFSERPLPPAAVRLRWRPVERIMEVMWYGTSECAPGMLPTLFSLAKNLFSLFLSLLFFAFSPSSISLLICEEKKRSVCRKKSSLGH
jgi:hypothetical protein